MNSKSIKILSAQKHLNCTIKLTGSKSESNRALIMEALSEGAVQVLNVSEAADTVTLKNILYEAINQALIDQPKEVNIGPAGTAMRFLSAFYTLQNGEIILTGSERMKQRPIGILVDALKSLGADIEYAEKEGYPPLKIRGPLKQKTDQVKIKGDISSQYISALLLIAPKLEQGLKLIIDGELTSKPYVEMTLAMMEKAGIRHRWTENEITISNQAYNKAEISIEPDWSAASYWYAIAALAEEASLFLPGLNGYSLQGDSKITEIMANFGITSQFKDGGVHLLKEAKKLERKIFDFKECPDLAQTVIVCCAAL